MIDWIVYFAFSLLFDPWLSLRNFSINRHRCFSKYFLSRHILPRYFAIARANETISCHGFEHVSNGARGLLQSTATRARARDEKWIAPSKHDNDCVSRSVAFHTDLILRMRARVNATLLLATARSHIMKRIYLRASVTWTFTFRSDRRLFALLHAIFWSDRAKSRRLSPTWTQYA